MNATPKLRRRRALAGALCAVVASATLGMASAAHGATKSSPTTTTSIDVKLVVDNQDFAWRTN